MASVTPPSSYVPPVQGGSAAPSVDGESVDAQVQNLPPSLQDTDRDLNLRGTVAGQNSDGTTRINTPRGPVDVQLPQPLPARGTDVNIAVPAGSPPRTVTVTLPQPQAQTPTQTPTPVPVSTTPTPQVPVPQTPSSQTPAPSSPSLPVTIGPQNPAPTQQPAPTQTQTPAPGQVPTSIPVPSDAPAPSPQQALPSGILLLQQAAEATHEQPMTPQGLLDFLKTSLQTFMKAPALPTQMTGNTLGVGMPEQNLAAAAQRPLQIGQLVRLTPLPMGQIPQGNTGAAIAAPFAGTRASLLPGAAATPNVIVPRGLTLGAPPQVQGQQAQIQTSLQTSVRAIMGQNVSLTTAQTQSGTQPVMQSLANRSIVPMLSVIPGVQIPQGSGTPGIVLPQGTAPSAQQFLIAMPADQTPHLIAPQNLDVRVSALLPSLSPEILQNPSAATLVHGTPSAPVLFAQVAGQTEQGLPILQLPTFTLAADGTAKPSTTLMVLQFPARGLSPATVLKLDVLPGTPMTTAAITAPKTLNPQNVMWDSLDDILHNMALQPQGPGTQAAALAAAIPKTGATAFTAPVLMLVSALRGGDITSWMGEKGIEAIRTLRRADALSRISGDFATSARHLNDDDAKPAGEWKSLNLPMMYGGEMNRVQLHYRSFEQDQGTEKDKKKTTGMRFVMDLSLTRMGPMQIDGFSLGKKLDVTLRSEQNMSAGMRETMRKRYFDAISSIGFSGELNFSADSGHKNWIDLDDHRGLGRPALA